MKTYHFNCASHVRIMGTAESRKQRSEVGWNCCRVAIFGMSVFVLLTLLPPNLLAEDKGSNPATQAAAAEPKGYDLQIYNGMLQAKGAPSESGAGVKANLKNVVNRLRETYSEANIMMPPSLGDLPIGDLKLRSSSLWEELEAIRVASNDKFEWRGPGMDVFVGRAGWFPPTPAMDPATGQRRATDPRFPNAGLFVLREPAPIPETQKSVEAFNIGPYLDWLAEKRAPEWGLAPGHPDYQRKVHVNAYNEGREQLMEMIAQTLKAFNEGRNERTPEPKFEFHEGARLLVVIGTREAIEITRKIVSALPSRIFKPSDFGVMPPRMDPSSPGAGNAAGRSPQTPPANPAQQP